MHCAMPAVLALVCLPCTAQVQAIELFVSPGGSDANLGTDGKPFATPMGARDRVRALRKEGLLRGGVRIRFLPGVYRVESGFALTPADSGTAEAPVTYEASRRGDVVLSGAKALPTSRFTQVANPAVLGRLPLSARKQVVRIDLHALGVKDYLPEYPIRTRGRKEPFMEVFFNGRRLPAARWPNEGFAKFTIVRPNGEADGGSLRCETEPTRPRRWNTDTGVWLLGFWRRAYFCSFIKVKTIDGATNEIVLCESPGLETKGGRRFYALNLLEELDQPGEWYLDRPAGVLYLWPPADLATATVEVSRALPAVVTMDSASHVTLRGFVIEGSRGNGINITRCNDVRVAGCEIRNITGTGVHVRQGLRNVVTGCDIHDTGRGGVYLEGGNERTLEPGGHEAVNNHIHHTSRVQLTHTPFIHLRGVGLRVAHNLMHHQPHQGVTWRGCDHVMEFNEIYMTNTTTTEGGVFYSGRTWTWMNNVIRYNFIHHINDDMPECGSSTRVVHLDDNIAGTTFHGNVCYLTGGGVSICGGPFNTVSNNLSVDCLSVVDVGTRNRDNWALDEKGELVERHNHAYRMPRKLRAVSFRKPPYSVRFPELVELMEKKPIGAPWGTVITNNVAVRTRAVRIGGGVKTEYLTVKGNWEGGDPGFVAPGTMNFALRPDSPVFKTGFKPIPFERIGLYEDPDRFSWPVKPEPPPPGWKPYWMQKQLGRTDKDAPVYAVRWRTADITIDGTVNPLEWTPGDATGSNPERYPLMRLEQTPAGGKTKYASQAWLERDHEHLYVGIVNDGDPSKKMTIGSRWGGNEAVEIALKRKGVKSNFTIVLRGYATGHFESSAEASPLADKKLVQRAGDSVQYAAKITGAGQWSAEWRIPLRTLGLSTPDGTVPDWLCNLSSRKTTSPQPWVMWRGRGGCTWDIPTNGGVLTFAPPGAERLRVPTDGKGRPLR